MRSKAPSSLEEKKIFMGRVYLNMLICLFLRLFFWAHSGIMKKAYLLRASANMKASAYPTFSPFEMRIYDKPDGKVYDFDSIQKKA